MIAKTALLALLLGAVPVYDETGHETVLYATARTWGFTPEDAAILANSSQSLDEQDSTTAFSFGKALQEGADWARLRLTLPDAPHMVTGQMFHALTEHREEVERRHHERIARAMEGGHRKLALFYMGQYLHFVADEVVHPKKPMFGHFLQGHRPDEGENNPAQLRAMIALVGEKLQSFKANRVPSVTDAGTLEAWKQQPPALPPTLEKVADAVARSWVPSMSQEARRVFLNSGAGPLDLTAPLDREKAQAARLRVLRVLADASGQGETYEPQYILLDANGDPPPGSFATLGRDQGFKHDINVLPFSLTAGEIPALKEERKREAEDLIEKMATVAIGLPNAAIVGLAAGPGGVALDPGLELPGDLGTPRRLTLRGDEILLETSSGTFVVDRITPRSFGTILRTVAAGEIPYVTMGTDPSTRPGYATVSYASALAGTAEGELLYRADIQFKAMFSGVAFPGDPLFAGFPGSGGDSMRVWISSSDLRLLREGDRLRIERPGMRILSETRLRGDPAADPRMEAYVAGLSGNWSALAERLPEFKAVELLALECALALWARRRGVPVDPAIWALPARPGRTPEATPVLLWTGRESGVCGGVTLAPEEQDRGPARHLLASLAGLLGGVGLWAWSLLLLAALLLAPPLVFGPSAYRRALKGWSIALTVQGLLAIPLWPIVSSRSLAGADRDFVAFLWVVAGPLVGALALRSQPRGWLRRGLSLGLPIASAWAGLLLALMTAGLLSSVVTPSVERAISWELSPAGVLGAASGCVVRTQAGEMLFVPAPKSITLAQNRLSLPMPLHVDDAADEIHQSGEPNRFMPWTTLRRVQGQSGRLGAALFTIDGKLPYDRDD